LPISPRWRVLPAFTRYHRVVLAPVRDPELERLAAHREGIEEVDRRGGRRAGRVAASAEE
jgi:hypothetical protein